MPRITPTRFSGIYVETRGGLTSSQFQHQTVSALDQLAQGHAGRTALRHIEAACEMDPRKRVVIVKAKDSEAVGLASADTVAKPTGDPFMPYVAGTGQAQVTVRFNPAEGYRYQNGSHEDLPAPDRSFVTLGHELIHASRLLNGATFREARGPSHCDWDTGAAEEELRTVGVGKHADEYPSENAIRREHGLELRPSYSGNVGKNLREPPERNSAHTTQRLKDLEAKVSPGAGDGAQTRARLS